MLQGGGYVGRLVQRTETFLDISEREIAAMQRHRD